MVQYPIEMGSVLRILNLGKIDTERKTFWSKKMIYPIGFKAIRKFKSMIKKGAVSEYVCEIIDGGEKPLYKITCLDDIDHPIVDQSASSAWVTVLTKISKL